MNTPRKAHAITHPTEGWARVIVHPDTPAETPLTSDERLLIALDEALTKARAKQPLNTHKRLFDLVRYQRAELHAADLITDDEYAWLCSHEFPDDPPTGSPSPRRLEDYDDLRARLAQAQGTLGFFASVIKSGESWSTTCQRELDAALKP